MSIRPVRKCLVASSRARGSRNCSMESSLRVMIIFSSCTVKSTSLSVSCISSSGESGTGGRLAGEPKREA